MSEVDDLVVEAKKKLLPCPFCGAIPYVLPQDPGKEGDRWAWVQCQNFVCPAKPRVTDGLTDEIEGGPETYKAVAIRRWNEALGRKAPEKKTELHGSALEADLHRVTREYLLMLDGRGSSVGGSTSAREAASDVLRAYHATDPSGAHEAIAKLVTARDRRVRDDALVEAELAVRALRDGAAAGRSAARPHQITLRPTATGVLGTFVGAGTSGDARGDSASEVIGCIMRTHAEALGVSLTFEDGPWSAEKLG